MKLASLVNLKPLKEGSMQARELADRNSLQQLQRMYDELLRDMEQEAAPEGGPIADQYADEIDAYENAIRLKKGDSGDEMTYDDMIKKHYGKSPKGAGPGGPIFESESKWNAVDVSRTAEKELSNREWNERTAKKLAILKSLNTAGKFKKDWDEEKLRDWVDQNYSWEKLSRQFKNINETMQQGEYTAIEQGWDGLPHDEQASIIRDALYGEARPDDFEKDFDQLKSEIPDFESMVAGYLGIDEGTCGYGKDGKVNPRDTSKLTPGGLKSMPADKRTTTMMRETIKRLIKKIHENK